MVVGVVSARERGVVVGVLVMEEVADDVVHAGVSGDETGREEGDEEEGDTVEAVDVGKVRWAGEEVAASSGVQTAGGRVDNGGVTCDHHLQT
ncbi:hypothetical protein NDU88_001875 [Pleurodeles waltl]|uniref:Uncharacterized protein n=1 Tax=Pleurodeles waltl TaxID=8319 RepID=A0AAV7Q5K3_PLEWA|nr:hypothetical protein NDU88_001875 [Pleurodeles waltl]